MQHPRHDRPPLFALAFFRWFCHREYREDIEGDLLERFHNRIAFGGARKAKWLFIKDVLKLFRPGIIGNLTSKTRYNLVNMKKVNWKKLTALNVLVVLMIVSPFIPGPSNKMVLAVSILGQIAGIFGLLLVPIGLAWLIIEIRRLRTTNKMINKDLNYQIAMGAALLIGLIFLLGVLFVPNPMPKISFLFGLLLMLTGFILAKCQIKKWKDNNENIPDKGASLILAASATSCITFASLFPALFAFVGVGIIPGILTLVILSIGLIWAIKRIRKLKNDNERKFNRIPLYFITIPLIAFLTLFFLVRPASSFSRNYAIKQSGELISAIENFKDKTGQYPQSIEDLYSGSGMKMPKPSIMGIGDFRYHKVNEHYSLSFSQWLDLGSLEEIVLYDKNDLKNSLTGELAKYSYSFDLHRVKGAFASHDTRYNNWRYYHVD